MYIYDREAWPQFEWNQRQILPLLAQVRYLQGRLLGKMSGLGFPLREEATLLILTQDVVKTSEIEGEKLNIEQVRSSLAKRLHIDIGALLPTDRNVEGIVEITLNATRHYNEPLTKERLYQWHKSLFPSDQLTLTKMIVGKWRTKKSGPMQVVSGRYGNEKIHYEAPRSERINKEMTRFLAWLHKSNGMDLVLKSALAHFWFVTIHPFEDGNGRIARAIADMTLAQCEQSPQRFYSMSTQIQKERQAYYHILESCQKGFLDITAWIEWYLNCLQRAIQSSDKILQKVLIKHNFWHAHSHEAFNSRQLIMINRLLDDFFGKLTTSKWAKITKCSQDTALRDINDLVERHILTKDPAGGRSTGYQLVQLD